jgi:uncharacterized SAM-binding protein YcdF (DUF218 family)
MVLAAGAAYVFRDSILSAMAAPLVEDDGAQKADCILVLGGDTFGYRTTKGGELARQGYAPYVLVDGPRLLMGPESVQMIAFAVSSGYPADLFRPVPLPTSIDSTSEESEYVANNVLRPQHIRKILLVTSNYHTRRAARFMRRTAPWLTVAVVPAFDPYFSVHGWWKSRSGKKTFLFEWLKTISEWWGD